MNEPKEILCRANTPWGVSDYRTDYAPGISFYSTPSHGGFALSQEKMYELYRRAGANGITTFCGKSNWFEEDCDCLWVYAYFPDVFDPRIVEEAKKLLHTVEQNKF